MDDETKELKNQIKLLKEKLKKKNERIKSLVLKNKELHKEVYEEINYARHERHRIFISLKMHEDLCRHMDYSFFKVYYTYEGKQYIEDKIPSYGARWILEFLLIELYKRRGLKIWKSEIEITKAEKLW